MDLKIKLKQKQYKNQTKIKMENKIIFKIVISDQYKIQFSCIDFKNEETIIKLHKEDNQLYSTTISFENYKISIGEEKENYIHFIEDLIKNPQEFKQYQFSFQEKEYSLIAEILFALLIKEFKQQI